MWACKKGHKDTAVLLCQWYQTVQNSNNNFNQDYSQPDILESVHQCMKQKYFYFSEVYICSMTCFYYNHYRFQRFQSKPVLHQ